MSPMRKTLLDPTAVPIFDARTQNEVVTFALAGVQNPTIPAGATGFLVSSLETGGNEFWLSNETTNPSGVRVGGVSASHHYYRLGSNPPTIQIRGFAGSNEKLGLLYFFGGPPGKKGSSHQAVDAPVWDEDMAGEQYALTAGATSQVFVPPWAKWLELSVLETGTPNEAFVSTEDTDDTGVKIGGNTACPLRTRVNSHVLSQGLCTINDSPGEVLNDAAASFVTDGVSVGDLVWNMQEDSFGRITSVNSETQLTHTALAHGADGNWERNVDHYQVYRGPNVYVHNPDGSATVDVGALFFAR